MRDIVLACDKLVVRDMGGQRRKGYAQALVQWGTRSRFLAAHPLAFGEVGIKDRVKNVLRYRRPAIRVAAAAAGLCLVATACFLTDPVTTTAPPPLEKAGYAAGALLYEAPALSYMPVDGRDYGVVQYDGEALTLDRDTLRPRFSLQETRELTRENGSAILWLGEGGAEPLRLYALVDLDKTLPYNISGVLWTYQPHHSELLPVRFAMAAEIQVERWRLTTGRKRTSVPGSWRTARPRSGAGTGLCRL